jgi:hypothetical protein
LLIGLPTAVQAQFNIPVFYTTNNGTITITGYESEGNSNPYGALIIPSTINGLPVTSIGNGAFTNLYGVTSITIPNSVTSIGDYAFARTFPNSITIGNGVTNIGDYAFYEGGFVYLTNVYFKGNAPSFGLNVFYGEYNGFIDIIPIICTNTTINYIPGTLGWGTAVNFVCPTAFWFLPNPLILNNNTNFWVQSNSFSFTISWATNTSVVIEASTTLANPIWSPVATNSFSNGLSYFSDSRWTNYPSRYYRVRSP